MPNLDAESLMTERAVLLQGDIIDSMATEIIARLLYLQDRDPKEWVTLLVDSRGGGVAPGMAILDTLQFLSTPVATRCIGEAYGMAGIIVAAGRKLYRRADRRAQLSVGSIAVSDHPGSQRHLDRVTWELTTRLCRYTGQPDEVVRSDLATGRVLDTPTAQVYGLIDVIDG